MCYDVNFKTNIELITVYLPDVVISPGINFNFYAQAHIQGQAYLPHPVIIMQDGKKVVVLKEWGIIAPYMKTPDQVKKQRVMMLNARSEKFMEKGTYWNRIRKNRCLMPVIGIYEHRKVDGFKKKIPYHVSLKSQPMFFLPCLFQDLVDTETGEITGTFAIATRAANSVMAQIHNDSVNQNRMPLFVTKDLAIKWLTDDSDEALEEVINFEMPSEELDYYPVYTIRGGSRPDGEEKDKPYDWGKVPEIVTA